MKSAFIITLILFSSHTVWASSVCVQMVANLELNTKLSARDISDPEWQRLFVRDPSEPIKDKNYLQNVTEAVFKVFLPWFKGDHKSSFEQMLRKHYVMMAKGIDGERNYNGITEPNTFAHSGVFYFETPRYGEQIKDDFSAITLPLNLDDVPYNLISQKIKNFPFESFRNPIVGIPEIHWPVTVRRSYSEIKRAPYLHSFPRVSGQPLYLKRLEVIMSEIQSMMKQPKVNREGLMTALSDYYHTGVNGHLFVRINSSLLMSQVNSILLMNHMRGISHESLDYVAFLTGTEEFRTYFINVIKKANDTNLQ